VRRPSEPDTSFFFGNVATIRISADATETKRDYLMELMNSDGLTLCQKTNRCFPIAVVELVAQIVALNPMNKGWTQQAIKQELIRIGVERSETLVMTDVIYREIVLLRASSEMDGMYYEHLIDVNSKKQACMGTLIGGFPHQILCGIALHKKKQVALQKEKLNFVKQLYPYTHLIIDQETLAFSPLGNLTKAMRSYWSADKYGLTPKD